MGRSIYVIEQILLNHIQNSELARSRPFPNFVNLNFLFNPRNYVALLECGKVIYDLKFSHIVAIALSIAVICLYLLHLLNRNGVDCHYPRNSNQ